VIIIALLIRQAPKHMQFIEEMIEELDKQRL
jgi:type II secretory pathway component GspD/PulD (secretin)